jgi:uncharacterized protein YbaR (Trm112 family)
MKNLFDLLACPVCKGDLSREDLSLACTHCGRKYPILDGVPILLPDPDLANVRHEGDLLLREKYNPWIERMIMQSLADDQVVLDAGCGNMLLDDPCLIRMDIQLTPYVDIVGDLHALPFKPASLDFIFSLAVFEHLRQPFQAAEEIYAALKPGGYVYAECNFVYAYHGFPHHYFNASIHGLRRIFSRFRELRCGVAPYQMPSFALENVLNSYKMLFKASTVTELMFLAALNGILQFPLRYYDRKFGQDTAYRVAAGDYYVGIKQPGGEETIIPPAVMEVYFRSPALQQRFPDPGNLAAPDNLLAWAKTEGRTQHPEIEVCFAGMTPFCKYADPARYCGRKIEFDKDLRHPDEMLYIEDGSEKRNPFLKMIEALGRKLFGKLRAEGLLGTARMGRRYFRN